MSSSKVVSGATDGWTLLRLGTGGDSSGLDIRTIPAVSSPSGPARLALGPTGEARLLLPLADREPPPLQSPAPSLLVVVSTYTKAGKALRFLDLTCLSRELEPVFADVVDEMFSRLASGISCSEAARGTLDDFRALLVPPTIAGPTTSVIAGLVGELLILNRLIDRSSHAWRAWRGPTGDRHDFRSGLTSLEVKASLKKGKSTVIINGANQLETNAGGTLHLLHLTLEVSFGGLLSVSGLARSALSKADQPSELVALLAAVGCPDPGSSEWNRVQFKLEDETLYEVDEGFPRIVGSMFEGAVVPYGVSELQYVVDLSVALSMRKDAARLEVLESELANCL